MKTIKKYGLKIYHVDRDPKIPKEAVHIGRPTAAQNPFLFVGEFAGIKTKKGIESAMEMFRGYAKINQVVVKHCRRKLKGLDLSCDCAACPAHAEFIMELANS